MSRAIRVEKPGGPEVLQWLEVPEQRPGPGQLLVRSTAVGVNFIDTYQRSGLYPLTYPSGLGLEAVGVVLEVGADVTEFKPGDRVATASSLGAYAEQQLVPAARAIPLPSHLEDEQVAASLLKGMTVEYLIRRTFPVAAGQTVLWHAAAGGVGLIACQWLSSIGVRVIGTVSTEEKAELARQHGCTHTVIYTQEDFVQRVRELTDGAGVPVVFDSVGKTTFEPSLDCLARRGTIVNFGNASGKASLPDVTLLSQKGSLYLTRPKLADYISTRAELLESANALFEVLSSGAVKPLVGQRFALSDASAAHVALESRATVGSVVLLPS